MRAGVRSIEHGTFLDDEAIALMVEHGTFLVPTIYIGDYYDGTDLLLAQEKNNDYVENDRPAFLAALDRAHEAGVKVAVGIDLGGISVPAEVFAREFAVLVEAGLSPMEAIQAGTRVGAEVLGWEDRLGTIEPRQARRHHRRARQPARGHERARARVVRDARRRRGEESGSPGVAGRAVVGAAGALNGALRFWIGGDWGAGVTPRADPLAAS